MYTHPRSASFSWVVGPVFLGRGCGSLPGVDALRGSVEPCCSEYLVVVVVLKSCLCSRLISYGIKECNTTVVCLGRRRLRYYLEGKYRCKGADFRCMYVYILGEVNRTLGGKEESLGMSLYGGPISQKQKRGNR